MTEKFGEESIKRRNSDMTECIQHTARISSLRRALVGLACLFLLYASPAEAKKRALLIGISDYPTVSVADGSWAAIHGANDINLLSSTLKKQDFSVGELLNSKATASNIRQALKDLTKQAMKGDLVYIHFSGHGQPFEDKSGDEKDGWDESIIPYDAQRIYHKKYKGKNHIIDDELEVHINNIRKKVGSSGFVYVILDACHMGGASRDESESESERYTRGTDRGFSPHAKKYIPKIDRSGHFKVKSSPNMSGICYMEACRSYQSNTEIKEAGKFYGPLSYYINKSLRTAPLSSNTSWTNNVVKEMGQDKRLIKQNPVIEMGK